MTAVSLTDPVNGTVTDANLIANNNQAIKTVVNGNLDNNNIAPLAAIVASKLANYPSDGSKVLKGDGTWGPLPTTALPDRLADYPQVNSDLNTATSTGWYSFISTTANRPFNDSGIAQVDATDVNNMRQVAYAINSDDVWMRRRHGGTWDAWIQTRSEERRVGKEC